MIYGYLRKSSEEGKTSSFDTQKFKINSYCNIHNLRVNEWFEDVCSGGLLLYQREQGGLLTTKLKKGDTIICSALDRYSRSHYGLVNDVEKYRRLKIRLIFTDLGDVISSDSLGSVFYQILSIMSEWYRKSLSEKQKIAKDKMIKQGKYTGGKVKKGYDLGENGQLVVCEKEQKEINLVKSLRAKGKKYKEIKSFMEKYTCRKCHFSFINKLLTRDREEQIIKNISNVELERNMCDV